MNSKHLCWVLILLFSGVCKSQNIGLGSWNIVHVKYSFDKKWSVFGEAQLRSLKFYDYFNYYEYKICPNYKLRDNITVGLGIGNYQTYNDGGDFVLPKKNNELRIWPQVLLQQFAGNLKIEHRYRAEFRFTSSGYRNRYRYRLNLAYSFGKKINDYQPFQISSSDELFFTNKTPYFERNRLQLSFSYKPSKVTTLMAGYLYQFDYKINNEIGNNYLQVGIFFDLFKNESHHISNDVDLKDI